MAPSIALVTVALWANAVATGMTGPKLRKRAPFHGPLLGLRASWATRRFRRGVRSSVPPLCIEGRSVPRLYMLGHQKCGTTTMADDLLIAGVRSPFGTLKELHTFDRLCNFSLIGPRIDRWKRGESVPDKMGVCDTGSVSTVKDWALMFPEECPQSSSVEEGTLADMTPLYLRLPSLPQVLGNVYGNRKWRLGFIVALREPLARLQSAYYHEQRALDLRLVKDTAGMPGLVHPDSEGPQGFEGHVRALGARLARIGLASNLEQDYALDQLYRSLYARNLKPWLEVYGARQFVIVPSMAYFTSEVFRAQTLETIGKQLNASVDASAIRGMPLSKENPIQHASLSEDLLPETVAWLEETIFGPELKKLTKMLALKVKRGLAIVGFNGTADMDEIADFLKRNW